ncbi:MAG: Rpn family recombination-promoting nuclease/putative transposase [Exilibacterium sp.]
MAGRNPTSPHDKFFHSVMERHDVAVDFLNHYLPSEIRRELDIDSLRLDPTLFVNNTLDKTMSDLIFQCKLAGKDAYIAILVEHQSTWDSFQGFRTYNYVFGLLNSYHNKYPKRPLPVVYPLVFYHGKEEPDPWSLNLLNLFEDPLRIMEQVLYNPVPLINITSTPDETLKQQQWLGPAALAMKHIREEDMASHALDILKSLFWPLDQPEGVELLKLLVNYMLIAGNILDIPGFLEATDRLPGPIRSEVMTFAEKLEEQSKLKGKQEVVVKMLREGADIAFITKVTELSVEDIEQLKASLDENKS